MTQIELDKGILERLMSSDISNDVDTRKDKKTSQKRNKSKKASAGDVKVDNADIAMQDLADVAMPIVQVINIQNIATSAFLLKYNKNTDKNSCRRSDTDSYEDVENDEQDTTKSSDRFLLILSDGEFYETRCLLLPNLNYLVNSSKLRKGSIIRLERYELNIIPNGKILVIDQLSVIKNTIKKQQSSSTSHKSNSQSNKAANENERKSIMNNNLAETLKSIGIIGSLKPTTNNSQIKQQQQGPNKKVKGKIDEKSSDTENTQKPSTTSKSLAQETQSPHKKNTNKPLTTQDQINTVIPTTENHNHVISNFNKRFKQQTSEFKQQYELIEQKFKEILNNERKCLASESSMSSSSSTNSLSNVKTDKNNNSKDLVVVKAEEVDDDEDEDNDNDDDGYEHVYVYKNGDRDYQVNFGSNKKESNYEDADTENEDYEDITLPIICNCTNCRDKNTLKLCYKMLDLNEKATKAQVMTKYLSLINSKEEKSLLSEIDSTEKFADDADDLSDNECNLKKLIKDLTKNKLFTINDSDRIEIITKAYNVIMGIQFGSKVPSTNVKSENSGLIKMVNKNLDGSENLIEYTKLDKKAMKKKMLMNDFGNVKIGDYLQYAWMRAANEFIRQEKASQAPAGSQASKKSGPKNSNNEETMVQANTNEKKPVETGQLESEEVKLPDSPVVDLAMSSSPSEISSSSSSECNHHHHHQGQIIHHQTYRRRVNRNPKAFYQQIKKYHKNQSLKAMRSKITQQTQQHIESMNSSGSSNPHHTKCPCLDTNSVCSIPSLPISNEYSLNKFMDEKTTKNALSLESLGTENIQGEDLKEKSSRSSSLTMKKLPAVIALPDVPSASLPAIDNVGIVGKVSDSKILSSDSSSSIKQSFEQQIEKELEIHLDSINSFKEKLLNFTRKCDSSLNLEQSSEAAAVPELESKQELVCSKRKEKNKKKNKKKLLQNSIDQSRQASLITNSNNSQNDASSLKQLKLEQDQLEKQLIEQQKLQQMQIEQLQKQIDEFVEAETNSSAFKNRLPLSVSKSINDNDLSLVLNDLSEALIKTNTLNHLKGDQKKETLAKLEQIPTKNLDDLTNKLEARIDFCDLFVGDETKKLKTIEASHGPLTIQQNPDTQNENAPKDCAAMTKFEENFKKIDSFQKLIYNQDLTSISSLISSISKHNCPANQTPSATQSNFPSSDQKMIFNSEASANLETVLNCAQGDGNHSKCQSCSNVSGEAAAGLSLLKLSQETNMAKTASKSILDRLDTLKEQKKLRIFTSRNEMNALQQEMNENYNSDDLNANEDEEECEENDEDEDDDDDYDTDEDEDETEKDHLITIIMKQPKDVLAKNIRHVVPLDNSVDIRLHSHSAKIRLQKKYDKMNRILIKDIVSKGYFKRTQGMVSREAYECRVEDTDECDDDDEDDDDDDDDEEDEEEDDEDESNEESDDENEEKNQNNAQFRSQLNEALKCHDSEGNRAPLVEEFLKTINDDEENIIFVQSLSSLAKKTLYNQQQQQQRKLTKRKQLGSIQGNTGRSLESSSSSGSDLIPKKKKDNLNAKDKLNALILEFEKQQEEKKLSAKLSTNSAKIQEIESTDPKPNEAKKVSKKSEPAEQPVKLTKNQRKKLKKQAKKLLQGQNSSKPDELQEFDYNEEPDNDKEASVEIEKPQKDLAQSKSSKKKKKSKNETSVQQVVVEPEQPKSKSKKSKKKANKQEAKKVEETKCVEIKKVLAQDEIDVEAKKIKRINDISDFSDQDLDIDDTNDLKTIETDLNTRSDININSKFGLEQIGNTSDESSADEGSWVKVAANGQHVQEKKKSVKKSTAVKLKPQVTVSSVSESKLGLDDFTDEPDAATGSKLSKEDLLIPNSVDEEELMFRKALELSLKESSISLPEKKPSKLGLDDFTDDIPVIKPKLLPPNSKQTVTMRQTSRSAQKIPLASLLKPLTTQKNISPQDNSKPAQIPPRPISFAAVTAASIKQKPAAAIPTMSIPAPIKKSQLGNSKTTGFKWGKPTTPQEAPELSVETDTATPALTLASYIPTASLQSSKPISNPQLKAQNSLQFKDNGVDRPITPQNERAPSPAKVLSLNTSLSSSLDNQNSVLNSLDLFSNEPMKPYGIGSLFSANDQTVTDTDKSHERRNSDYFSLTNMTSSLEETNPSCLLSRLSISSTSASLLTLPDNITEQPLISPIKKPIGAERNTGSNSARNSLISPNDTFQPTTNIDDNSIANKKTPPLVNDVTAPTRPSSAICKPKEAETNSTKASGSNNTATVLPTIHTPLNEPLANPKSTAELQKAINPPLIQKQTIRVSPQQKTQPPPTPPLQSTTPSAQYDQLQRLKQVQQAQALQQQQTQSLLNNLFMLLSNNQGNIDQQQMASLILYVNNLLNQINVNHSSNYTGLSVQQQQQQQIQNQKINDSNLLMIKNIIQQQQSQQIQSQFNQMSSQQQHSSSDSLLGKNAFLNPTSSTNEMNHFHNSNISNILNNNNSNQNAFNNQQQQQTFTQNQYLKQHHHQQQMTKTSSQSNNNLWGNDFQLLNMNQSAQQQQRSVNFFIGTSPSPPPTNTNTNTNSSSSSIVMQSNSSTSSTPSPHLTNPQGTSSQTHQNFSSYNHFSNGNGNTNSVIGQKQNSIGSQMAQMNHRQQQYQPFQPSANTSNFPYSTGNNSFINQNGYGQYNPLLSGSNTNLTSTGSSMPPTNKVAPSLLPNPIGWQSQHGSVAGAASSDSSSVILNRSNNFEI